MKPNDGDCAAWVRLSEVEPESVSWLWLGKIPFGKLTILEGDQCPIARRPWPPAA